MSTAPQMAPGLALEPEEIGPAGVRMVRILLAVSGVSAVLLGILLLVVPAKTIWFFALVVGIQIAVAGAIRLVLGIFGHWDAGGHRLLTIFLGVLMIIGGIIILRDLNLAAVLLLRIAILFTGISWIVDGIGSLVEAGSHGSRTWGILFGVLSIVAGLVILVVARWAILWLIIYAAISLLVLGISSLVRAFTFGRDAKAGAGSRAAPRAGQIR